MPNLSHSHHYKDKAILASSGLDHCQWVVYWSHPASHWRIGTACTICNRNAGTALHRSIGSKDCRESMDRLEPRIAGLLIHRSGLSQYSYPPGMIRIAACQKEKKNEKKKRGKHRSGGVVDQTIACRALTRNSSLVPWLLTCNSIVVLYIPKFSPV